jgi:hypothetical protein
MNDFLQAAKLRAEARFAQTQRGGTANEKVMVAYKTDIQAVRDKTARLRALRLEKEAAEASTAPAPSKPGRRKT